MIDHSFTPGRSPAWLRSGELLLRTAGACDLDAEHLLEVFAEQRRRVVAILAGFGPGDWAAPTRCADWSAHDVVRHLCDCNAIGISAGPDDRTLDIAAFDPRITPREWLTASASESPDATFSRFEATTEQVLAIWRARLTDNRRFDVQLPYGPMDWTVMMLHGFWDSWLHERDVLLGQGIEHPTGDEAIGFAASYGLFIAAAVASMFGDPVQQKLTLGGDGGGVFELDNGGGVVMLTATRAITAGTGPHAAEVVDALAGRVPTASVFGGLPASARISLSRLADFLNTPVD